MTYEWLSALADQLGLPEHLTEDETRRWLWDEGERGIRIDKLTHAWQVVCWSPLRSVTVRSIAEPDDETCSGAVSLAALGTHLLASSS
jgi:hypothetical protein